MATTQNTFNGNGSNLGPFSFTFKWLESTDIKVSVGGVLKTAGTHYNLQGLNYTTKTGGQVLFTAGNAPPVGTNNIRIYRDTDDEALSAVFSSGSAIRAKDLNDNFTQNLYVTQEINNNAVQIDGSQTMVGDLNMGGYKITNLATPTASGNAATKDYVDASSGNGGIPGHTRWRKVATASQTIFSGTGDYGGVLAYSPTREQVYINGALQQRGVDYAADNGTSVIFTVGLTVGDVVDIICVNNLTNSAISNAGNITYSGQFTGQTARTVAAKLTDVVSVKDFIPEGTDTANTDCTAYIQAAIATNAKCILFPPGTYKVNSNSVAPSVGTCFTLVASNSGTWFKGESATIKPASNRIQIFAINGATGCKFSGITFDNSANGILQNQTAGSHSIAGGLGNSANTAIGHYLGTDLKIDDCSFKNFNTGLYYIADIATNLTLGGLVTVTNSSFDGCAFGILANTPRVLQLDNLHNKNNVDSVDSGGVDPGHLLYVTDRSGAFPEEIVINNITDTNGQSSCLKVRKSRSVCISNVSVQGSHKGIEIANALTGSVSNCSIVLANITGGQTNRNALDIGDCGPIVVSGISIDIRQQDAWGIRVRNDGVGASLPYNSGLVLTGCSIYMDHTGSVVGKAGVVLSDQRRVSISNMRFGILGSVQNTRALIDCYVITDSSFVDIGATYENIAAQVSALSFDASSTNNKVYYNTMSMPQYVSGTIVSDSGSANTVTGDNKLLLSGGTATFPSLAFSDQPNTGFYRSGTSTIGVALNGTQACSFLTNRLQPATDLGYNLGTSTQRFGEVYTRMLTLPEDQIAPGTATGFARIYVDSADGDLKVKFGDGVTKTIVTDT